MTILFVFFALPLATILLAIVLQKVLKCPILVAITFFAIYLIVAFVAFSSNLAFALIATIIYTILAFITALLVQLLNALRERLNNNCDSGRSGNNESCCRCNARQRNCCNDDDGNLLRISYSCPNSQDNNLLTINSNCGSNSNNDNGNCGCNNDTNNGVAVTASVIPCNNNGGRTGTIRGCYRRR